MLAQKVSTRGASVSARPVAIRAHNGRKQVSVVARAFTAGMGVFGTKAGMMSFFTPAGLCVPATVIALEGGNIVTQVKTVDTDGYNAVQIGYKVVAERKVKKPELGHLAKSGAPPMKILREFKLKDRAVVESYTPGQQLDVSELFKEGMPVDIAGLTVGKGFQGGWRRGGVPTRPTLPQQQVSCPVRHQHRLAPAGRTLLGGRCEDGSDTAVCVLILKIDLARSAIIIKGTVPGKAGCVVEVMPAKFVGKNC
ncbi:MAG: hypothetical protein WDW38_004834 [Sanguina aurantia]